MVGQARAGRAAEHAGPVPARRLERPRVDRERRRARRRDRRSSAGPASPPTTSARSTRTSPRAWPSWTASPTRRPGCSSASTSAASRRPGSRTRSRPRAASSCSRAARCSTFVSSRVGPRGALVHDPAGHLGVHHRLGAQARQRAAGGRPAEHRVRAAPVLGGDAALGQPEEAARDEVEHEPQAGLRAEPGRQPADARGAAGAGPRARRARRAARAAAQRGDRRRQLRHVAAAVPGAGRGARARSTARRTSTSTRRSTSPAATSRTSRISSRPGASSGNMHWRRSLPRSSARRLWRE